MNRTKYALCNANDFKVLDYIWKFHGENKNSPPVARQVVRYPLDRLQRWTEVELPDPYIVYNPV